MSNGSVKKREKIMVFGTFDGVHPGHLDFFKQAKRVSHNPFLVVSIARDENVKKIKKSYPKFPEIERKKLVEDTKIPDKVVLGSLNDYIAHILDEKPEIIALGYDQIHYTQDLEEKLFQKGLNIRLVRLKPHKENIYKNSLLKRQ